MPVLLYGIDVCPVTVPQIRSFEFSVNRMLIKVFKSTSFEFINECLSFFRFQSVIGRINRRKFNFLNKLIKPNENYICELFSDVARKEMISIGRLIVN